MRDETKYLVYNTTSVLRAPHHHGLRGTQHGNKLPTNGTSNDVKPHLERLAPLDRHCALASSKLELMRWRIAHTRGPKVMRICMPVFVHSLSYLYYVLGSPRCSPPSLPALGIVLAIPIPSNAMNPSLQPVDVLLSLVGL
ncbi:uncharacterized protein CLUP02_16561 [Colletotrichum lupini]|uniref:Uncharacterized protein n=1 Tax=Colletotrichum lupini TaxID=145971 RepID=A0A9Q8WPB9_9PEZI|nr:uncharacterized protein CLUP02_16561 [Colletotrichum lupini]UQC91028.1 hypothetical protein CLUP02_16561 [Colletotrichum lupini]